MKLIHSNYDIPEWCYEDARECLEDMNDDTSEDAVYNAARLICDQEMDFYLECLEQYFKKHSCLVLGSIGRWDGTYSGGQVVETYRDFIELLEDCDYIEIYDNNGYITVEGIHHDGRVQFTIKELTEAGENWYLNHEYDYSWTHNGRDVLNYLKLNINSRKPTIEWCL